MARVCVGAGNMYMKFLAEFVFHLLFVEHMCDSYVKAWQHLAHISETRNIKGARSDCFRFFSNFRRFWYQKKAHIFLITSGEFYSWKMYRLEDINENVTSYGYHN